MQNFSEQQKEFLRNLFTELNTTVNTKSNEIRNEIKENLNELKNETLLTSRKFEEKIVKLENENKELRQNIIYLERRARKNNLVIFGINLEEPDLLTSVLKVFSQLDLKIEVGDINSTYRVKTQTNNTSPVIVEFVSFQQKLSILKNAYKLKGKSIYISNDQCKEDRDKYKVLLNHHRQARAKGESAYIRGGKLYIANEPYTVEQLEGQQIEYDEDIGNTEEKANSAPPTPNHTARQKKLNEVLGLEVANSEKTEKVIHKIDPKEIEALTNRITRSNTGLKKK